MNSSVRTIARSFIFRSAIKNRTTLGLVLVYVSCLVVLWCESRRVVIAQVVVGED